MAATGIASAAASEAGELSDNFGTGDAPDGSQEEAVQYSYRSMESGREISGVRAKTWRQLISKASQMAQRFPSERAGRVAIH